MTGKMVLSTGMREIGRRNGLKGEDNKVSFGHIDT